MKFIPLLKNRILFFGWFQNSYAISFRKGNIYDLQVFDLTKALDNEHM